MYLISWNCASWKTTVDKHISVNHLPKPRPPTSSASSSSFSAKPKQKTGLEEWLNLLAVDILCLQEVKIKKGEIEGLATKIGARSNEYDVFFATPFTTTATTSTSSNGNQQTGGGLNGVATFVKKWHTIR
jgi:exonuclease III